MTPIVSFVGYSNSGKTTFLVKVIRELKSRGYRIGVIKHDGHDFEIDHIGSDTWKHRQAGADVVCIASDNKIAIMETPIKQPMLDDIAKRIGDVDLIVTEGFKKEGKPQIEVNRQGMECLGRKENTIAVVADQIIYEDVVHFGFCDAGKVADFLENQFNLLR
jgi:molybdopterin-guanine dinucleotide biosynthesis protein B